MTEKLNSKTADLVLLFITFVWGISNVISDYVMAEAAPIQLCAIRFGLAFLLCAIFLHKKMKNPSKKLLLHGAVLGLMLSLVYILAMYGILYTNMTNFSFLVGQTVTLTPVFAFVFCKKRIDRKLLFCLFLALVGLALMTMNGGSWKLALGDWLALASAASYAGDIVYTEYVIETTDVDAEKLGIWQIGFAALFLAIIMLFTDPQIKIHSPGIIASCIFLAAFPTFIAFVAQPVAQQFTVSSHVGIIFAAEPIFSSLADFIVNGSHISLRGYFGAALMLTSVLIMNLGASKNE